MSTFGPDDSLWVYQLLIKEAAMKPNYDLEHIVKTLYHILTDYGTDFMDLRSIGSGSTSHGIFDEQRRYIGSKTIINKATIGIVTFEPLGTAMIKDILLCPEAYPIVACQSLTISSEEYAIKDLELALELCEPSGKVSACGCTVRKRKTYPLMGLYKGLYMDQLKAKDGHYNSIHGASWNYKSEPAIKAVKAQESCPVRTASIMASEKEIWSLGFGWVTFS